MGFIIGIMLGVCLCYWLKISAQTRQELIQKNAEFEVMAMLARDAMANARKQDQ